MKRIARFIVIIPTVSILCLGLLALTAAADAAGVDGIQVCRALDSQLEGKASAAALEAYRKVHPTEQNLTAKVTDYGCHIQVDVRKEGKVIASYAYRDGKVFEI